MQDYLNSLNGPQREAVTNTDGHLLLLAGAGSGKTRVLVCRCAYILDQYLAAPQNILAITFTNKAAKELKDRITSMIGDEGYSVWAMTFHSLCLRILRQEIGILDYQSNFVIYDTDDQLKVMKQCVSELNLNDKQYPPRGLLDIVSKAKNRLISPERFAMENKDGFQAIAYSRAYALYQRKLKEYNALDFDDLIMLTVQIFKEYPEIRDKWSRRFKYVMVDEYQDTNNAQYILVTYLSGYHGNLCVVGDDDQSIYGWRGADISNILDFEKQFKDTKTIKLEQNYRSTSTILDAANSVISRNTGRKDKALWTDKGKGELIHRICVDDAYQEPQFVVKNIKEQMDKGRQYKDFAVMYRTNAQSRVFEEAFNRARIPYKLVGATSFYKRKEIKDVTAYLQVICNPGDSVSLRRIINVPARGIGDTTIEKMQNYCEENGISLFMALSDTELLSDLRAVGLKVKAFGEMMHDFRQKLMELPVDKLMEYIIDRTGLITVLEEENTIEAEGRIDNIREYINVATQFAEAEDLDDKSLQEFLASAQLASDTDGIDDKDDSVLLLTLHSAKGLEFPVVYLVGMEEGVFPGLRSMEDPEEMEEERRLAYVGITRAKEQLYLLNARSRMMYGKTTSNRVSRFEKEIPEELYAEAREVRTARPETKSAYSYNPFGQQSRGTGWGVNISSASDVRRSLERVAPTATKAPVGGCNLEPGNRVAHRKFGEGTVLAVSPENGDYLVEVSFDQFGMKRMLYSMAKLNKI
ncbi:MAG: UvrD-helicase domain-containing protein [Clostridia bacterium]|nr:UvrD-helicase domain-containing protein [Clostridia bacterium]